MYKIVSTISGLIRVFIFPNPFTKFFEIYLADTVLNTSTIIIADVFNFIVGGSILCAICFPLVGIIYDRGEEPVVGAFLYMGAVLINSWLLNFVSNTLKEPNLTSFFIRLGIILIIEIGTLIKVRHLKEKVY